VRSSCWTIYRRHFNGNRFILIIVIALRSTVETSHHQIILQPKCKRLNQPGRGSVWRLVELEMRLCRRICCSCVEVPSRSTKVRGADREQSWFAVGHNYFLFGQPCSRSKSHLRIPPIQSAPGSGNKRTPDTYCAILELARKRHAIHDHFPPIRMYYLR